MTDQRQLMARALRELQRAERRIRELEQAPAPIAVVGMGCRLPGGIDSPAALWSALAAGREAVAPVPASRWPADGFVAADGGPGTMAVHAGSFLDDALGFDAAFFRIAPREAELMDPQQRLLLEVVWHALEHAGLAADRLRDRPVGVFVGISTDDWAQLLSRRLPQTAIEGAAATGSNHSAAAGRISFALGLQGPSLAVNTACSSSLVALHLACQSLRGRECELAVVAGVNVMLSPWTMLTFARGGLLAPDGRCKTFGSAADGYGRGEGAVALVLARADDAAARRLRSDALVLGSAVNQDGASAGFTVPNGAAQRAVLTRALQAAGVPATAVQYVEAHGTGTALGDPIELAALAAVYGAGRDAAAPLLVGSVKTNFGHTEAAAGLLGCLKAILQLQHRTVVPHLHGEPPNPHVRWAELPLRVPAAAQPWPTTERAVAGVSSFGFTGTNVHAILAQAPATDAPAPTTAGGVAGRTHLLPLSARTPASLAHLCARWRDRLRAQPDLPLADATATAFHGRSHLRQRAAAWGATAAELATALDALVRGQPHPCTRVAAAPRPVHAAAPDALEPAALAEAWTAGAPGPLAAWFAAPFRRVDLPLYPFEHRTFAAVSLRDAPASTPPGAAVAAHSAPPPAAAGDATLRARLAAADADHHSLLREHLRATAAAVLRLPPAELPLDEPLPACGFDSLLAAELKQRLEHDLALPLTFTALLDDATIDGLARQLAAAWRQHRLPDAGLLADIEAMTDAEVERALDEGGRGDEGGDG